MRTRQGVTGNAGFRVAMKAVLSLLLIVLLVAPFGSSTRAEGDEGLSDLSLYQRTSELTRELGTKLAPGSQSDLGMLAGSSASDKLTGGNAGGLLGYSDVGSDDKGVLGWLMTPVTGSSKTTTYDQILNMVPSGSTVEAGFKNPFFQYAGYGEALHIMGLTSTIREGDVLGEPGRLLGTGIMLIAYLLANVAPFIFRMALFILVTFNPFRFFSTVFDAASAADLGMLSGLADYVGTLYATVQEFSLYILLPMFLVMMLLSILMVKKGSALQKIGRYATRVFMLFAGLPLIAATYTGTVEGLQAKVNVGSEYANYLVLSSYVDFEGWVKTSRLAPPKDNVIRNPRVAKAAGKEESMTLPNRSLVLEINGNYAGSDVAKSLADRYDSTSNLDEIFGEGGKLTELKSSSKTDAATNSGFSATISMLMRHISTSTYSGAQYDGEVAGQIQKIRSASSGEARAEVDEHIVKMFSLTASDARTWKQCSWFGEGECQDWMKPIDWDEAEGLFTKGAAVDGTFKFGNFSQNIYNSGALTFEAVSLPNGGGTLAYVAHGVNPPSGGLAPIGTTTASTMGGLSPLAMYNFLNTRFSDTGIVVYSTEKSLSELTKGTVSAVTFAGSGISVFTRWLENVVVMLSLASLSIMYGVMMLSAALRNIPRILSGVFGTAMGSIAMATKLLVSTLVMIIQVIGMIFLYALSENILMTMLLNFNEVTSDVSNFFQQGSIVLEFARATLVIATTAGTTIFLIKNMNTFREMMEEVVTNLITRIMGVLDTSTGGQGLSAAEMSGGRVDNSGHLTDAAKRDNKYGGLMGGVARALGDAHGLESERERMAEDLAMQNAVGFDEDGNPLDKDGNIIDTGRSLGEKIKARAGTGKELHDALARDKVKALGGVDGKSYDRELGAQQQKLKALAHGDATALGRSATNEYNSETKKTNNQGQLTDENGELQLDKNGNALDAEGNAISAASALSLESPKKAFMDDEGHLLDEDGSFYTDELGNAFKQDDKGRLIDEAGNFVALDADGSLRPVEDIPGHNGKPVNATKEAKKLDGMRRDAKAYADMRDAQGASHYGLDKDGNVTNAHGEPVALRNGDMASLDKDGFLVNKAGERVDAREIVDKMDERGYEKVTDPETGATHMRHRGDAAMRNRINPADPSGSTATTLAKQAARAHDIASRAQGRVEQLAAAGAAPYAIAQAQRYAAATAQQAKETQNRYMQAISTGDFKDTQPVTREHVQGASRGVDAAKKSLQAAEAAVQTLTEKGAPPKQIARAQTQVANARAQVAEASTKLANTQLAAKAGRSLSEVTNARDAVQGAEGTLAKAQNRYVKAVASNDPEVIQKAEANLYTATTQMAARRSEFQRVSQKPSGSRVDIDKATAKVINSTTANKAATEKLQKLQQQGAPAADIKQAQREVSRTAKQVTAAKNERASLLNPKDWSNETPALRPTSTASVQKSAAALQSAGIVTYEDYGREVAARTESYQAKRAKLKSEQQRLKSSEGKRPPQLVAKMRETVAALQQEVSQEQKRLDDVRQNAHGLLKAKKFKPMTASRPLQTNGAVILNQMTVLREAQSSIDRLSRKAAKGTITETEQATLQSLRSTTPDIRKKLVAAGIREDALSSTAAIAESAKHFGQSWDSFINGTSTEV